MCRRTSASDASRMWVAPIPKWPYRDLNLFWDRLSALSISFTSSVSLRWCRPAFLKPVSWRHNTWRKRRSPAPSRYGRGAVGQLGVLSLPMQRPSFPFGLGPPIGQGWRAVKGPGPSRTSGWLVFCRLDAVYGYSETSNIWYESTTYYYTKQFVFFQVILALRYTGYLFSSAGEVRVIGVTRKLTGYGLIGPRLAFVNSRHSSLLPSSIRLERAISTCIFV